MLGKRLINSNDAAGGCPSDEVDILGDNSGVALYQLNWDGSDMSGNYDGVATDVSFVNGKIDSAGSFNGSSSKIETNIDVFNTTTYSVSFWVNVGAYKNASYNHWCFIINNDQHVVIGEFPANTLKIYFSDFSSSNAFYTITDPAAWYNVVVTRSGNSISMYVNGTLANSFTYTGMSQGTSFKLGVNHTNNAYLDGKLDQVRIFNTALTQANVDTLYAEAACVKTCTTDTPQLVPDCIAYYKLDGNADDSNGTATVYDGTPTDVSWTQGRLGSAAGFNGSSSQITNSGTVNADSDFSISIWFNNKGSATDTGQNLWGANNRDCALNFDFNTKTVKFYLWDGSLHQPQTSSILSGWNHIVATRSKTNGLEVYLNGSSEDTNSFTGNADTLTSTETIGNLGRAGLDRYFNGSIDQVRIYDRAITAEQVTTLYNEVACPSGLNFNSVIYTGNGSTQNVGGVEFQPDFVWIKNRDYSSGISHFLADSVRGGQQRLASNTSASEVNLIPYGDGVMSFDSNGFTVADDPNGDNGINGQVGGTFGSSYVAWCWKAGGDAVTNTDGTITSDVSANVAAGFSIVKYTTTPNTSDTIGHGLSSAPELIITKSISNSAPWYTYSSGTGTGKYLTLDSTDSVATFSNLFNTVTTDAFQYYPSSIQQNYIAYCFHSVAGYQKVGSYTGNRPSTKTVYTTDDGLVGGANGFRPRFLMIKDSSTAGEDWIIVDSQREGASAPTKVLYPSTSGSEDSYTVITFTSNGFTVGNTGLANTNGATIIYLAIA